MVSKQTLQARCGCKALVVELAGVPERRFLCCCSECQRRTGAAFSISWYYPPGEAAHLQGDYATFRRVGTAGTPYAFHYCTSCGSTVFWTVESTGDIGVAAGCIPAADHVAPVRVVWVQSRVPWVPLPTDIPWHGQGTASAVVRTPYP